MYTPLALAQRTRKQVSRQWNRTHVAWWSVSRYWPSIWIIY